MDSDKTLIQLETGGRLAVIQPGVIGWHYVHWIDAREFTAWFRVGVKLDGCRVDKKAVKVK